MFSAYRNINNLEIFMCKNYNYDISNFDPPRSLLRYRTYNNTHFYVILLKIYIQIIFQIVWKLQFCICLQMVFKWAPSSICTPRTLHHKSSSSWTKICTFRPLPGLLPRPYPLPKWLLPISLHPRHHPC